MSDQPIPTIGRIVLYKDSGSNQIHPALVTAVHSDTIVNLAVMFDGGEPFAARSVNFIADIDAYDASEDNNDARWGWMPYQKAVHAGTTEPTKHA